MKFLLRIYSPQMRRWLSVAALGLVTNTILFAQAPDEPGYSPDVGTSRPMQGGADAPFTDFGSDGSGNGIYNYSSGAPAEAFNDETFEQLQDGAVEDKPGAYRNTKYRWYGFARLDSIYDFNPIRSTDSFVTGSIPVPQGEGDNFVMTPRYTRLGFDTSTDIKGFDYDVNTRVELDFFNGNTSGLFGSYPLRMRFAWVDFGPLLVGQASSVFMDFDAFPNVLDYQGPPGMILMRQGLARLKFPISGDERTTIAMGMEQPYSDIQWENGGNFIVNPGTGIVSAANTDRNIQSMPDFTGNLRREGDYGHLQAAGILRRLSFRPAVGEEQSEVGYGGNLTGSWHPWAWLHDCNPKQANATPMMKSRFVCQYAAGTGINRYFQDPNGAGLDAVFSVANGFQTIDSRGYVVAYEQWWAKNWLSNFTYSGMNVDTPSVLPVDTFDESRYVTANLIWLPFERLGVGMEFLYGERKNLDGQAGEAYRIQSGLQYKF